MDLNINLKRKWYTDKSTIGELFFDDFKCFTLEDRVRSTGIKIKGKTAIPPGIYEIGLIFSPKFSKIIPRLLHVPGFNGILIHPGNTPENTDGCILVGKIYDPEVPNQILESRLAFNDLMDRLEKQSKQGIIFINIT